MIYIGFSKRTHKLYAKILCKRFKHCAPVVIHGQKCYLYQFVNRNNIVKIELNKRDLTVLKHYGWIFVKYSAKNAPQCPEKIKAITCVQFTKRFCHIQKKCVLTPYDLFRFIHDK